MNGQGRHPRNKWARPPLPYNVATIRAAGLQCRWGKHRNTPVIVALHERSGNWIPVTKKVYDSAERVGYAAAVQEAAEALSGASDPEGTAAVKADQPARQRQRRDKTSGSR